MFPDTTTQRRQDYITVTTAAAAATKKGTMARWDGRAVLIACVHSLLDRPLVEHGVNGTNKVFGAIPVAPEIVIEDDDASCALVNGSWGRFREGRCGYC